jgi:hypothetical protein
MGFQQALQRGFDICRRNVNRDKAVTTADSRAGSSTIFQSDQKYPVSRWFSLL